MRQASTAHAAAKTTKKVRMPSRMADGHRVGGSAKRRRAITRNTAQSVARTTATAAGIVPARIRSCWKVSNGSHRNRAIVTRILGRLEDIADFADNHTALADPGERGPALGQVMGQARIVGVLRSQFADKRGDPAVNSPEFILPGASGDLCDRVDDRDPIDKRELVGGPEPRDHLL
jgi:hypothetical protein